jgi:hypothetical protein
MVGNRAPFIVTDGFEYYARVVREIFSPTCIYAQVLKTRRNDRIISVERRQVIGTALRFQKALFESEESSTLNTSIVERLNLTIRQGCAYLTRRSACHARCEKQLENQIEIVRCHYNFLRPHRKLKFGSEMRTPAMQAGLTSRRLTFREIFSSTEVLLALENLVLVFPASTIAVDTTPMRRRLAA